MKKAKIAVIGGTGIYNLEAFKIIEELDIETPWGKTSDKIMLAEFEHGEQKHNIAFLPRHGKGHFIAPTMIPQKANIAALKMLKVEKIIAFSAVGSLKEEIAPNHFILPNQIIDRTRHREDTYYNEGVVVHVMFGDPFSEILAKECEAVLKETDIEYHKDETLICMEGPSFSTRAESKLYKSWGAGIINMSVLPEAKLARELEMCYQMICMSTDYDSWREEEASVSVEEIMAVVKQNSENAGIVLNKLLPRLVELSVDSDPARSALKFAIITDAKKRPAAAVEKLKQVLPDYF